MQDTLGKESYHDEKTHICGGIGSSAAPVLYRLREYGKYYDEVLQLRVSEAPDDRDMVERIYKTAVFDPGFTYCDGSDQLRDLHNLV